MLSAQWWTSNPLYHGALVDVLTYGESECLIKTYDGATHVVETSELERRG